MNIDDELIKFKNNLLESAVLPSDLKKWNKIQKKIWLSFIKENNVNKNDFDLFSKLGSWFHEFYSDKGKVPTFKDWPSFKVINTYTSHREASKDKRKEK